MSLKDFAKKQLSATVLVTPVQTLKEGAPVDLGLPLYDASAPNSKDSISGHFRVLSVDGDSLCSQSLLVNLTIDNIKGPPTCGEAEVYAVLIPLNLDLPYLDLTYGPSLLDSTGSGCDASGGGSASASYDAGSKEVTVSCSIHAKVKCFGNTVFDASGGVTLSKNLNQMTPCVGFDNRQGPFGVRGQICYQAPASVVVKNIAFYVVVDGNEYGLGGCPDITVGVGGDSLESCHCK